MLLDQSEDTTNSQRPQDRTHDLQLLTHAGPVKGQDDECEDDNRKIEVVPAVFEVQAALGDQFDDGFDGEDGHEAVVDYQDGFLEFFALHVPVEGQKCRVGHDCQHDEQVERRVLSYYDAVPPQR